jgi:hypothetical protein
MKIDTKKPLTDTHEVNLAPLCKQTTEQSLNPGILQKVDKVINIQAKQEWCCGRRSQGVIGIANKFGVKTRILKGRLKINRDEN